MAYEAFKQGYMEAIEFTEAEELGDVVFSEALLDEIEADCKAFYHLYERLWRYEKEFSDKEAGVCFWLSRNGHGAGFFDSPIVRARTLQELASACNGLFLYVGDDGKVYSE